MDWNKLILDAAYRRPPFETGDKEKGFRDALVAESFMQLLRQSPTSGTNCWTVLVTNDDLLARSVQDRTEGQHNVRIFQTLEELKALINTLASAVDENFVNELAKRAEKYFFFEGDEQKKSLAYKESISSRIKEQFKEVLSIVPERAETRENGTFLIGLPRFVKKEGQRVHWVTLITVEAKAFKYVGTEPPFLPSTVLPTLPLGAPPPVSPPAPRATGRPGLSPHNHALSRSPRTHQAHLGRERAVSSFQQEPLLLSLPYSLM